ncbi:ogr/Delta-like zinc finger family protein [Klebsiella electrica]|uniref:ogr/Delta-like zinc finger family protein n=1 Tax=Klebsiella electrica TaxID=1259973 RepID=UPI003F75A2A3
MELEVKNDDLPIFLVSSMTKERYNQCQNLNCSHTFVTHETFVRSISTAKEAHPVQPHPLNSGQAALSL